jgi:hypothetical protein
MLSEGQGRAGGHGQQQDDDVLDLVQEDDRRGALALLFQTVGAVAVAAFAHGRFGEALPGGHVQVLQDLLGPAGPRRFCGLAD